MLLYFGGALLLGIGTLVYLAFTNSFEEKDFDFDTNDEHDEDYL